MSPNQQRLWVHRQALVQESARLRERLVQHADAVGPVLDWADKAKSVGGWMREHPWVPAVGLVVWVWMRPRMVWRWARRAWALRQLIVRVRSAWGSPIDWLARHI